jgi:hypothetical protein
LSLVRWLRKESAERRQFAAERFQDRGFVGLMSFAVEPQLVAHRLILRTSHMNTPGTHHDPFSAVAGAI